MDDPLNLRAVRLRMALAYALTAGVVIALLAWVAYGQSTARLENQLEAELVERIADASLENREGQVEAEDTWYVIPADGYSEPLGEFDVEPPLRTVGAEALDDVDGIAFVEFTVFDEPYLAYGRAISEDEAIVAVAWAGFVDQESRSLLLILVGASVLGVALTGYVSFVVSGRALSPARDAMRRRQDFIADAAHQLRTPLATITASASLALSGEREPEDYRTSLAEIGRAADGAAQSVTGLLDLARLEAGTDRLQRQSVRLDLLVEEVADRRRPAAAAEPDGRQGIEVHADEPVVVSADPRLLAQAISNVLDNATARAADVHVKVRTDRSDALIEVTDDGPGFPADRLDDVFERFRQGDRKGSSGLGLAITATILRAHGGTATAANLPDGGAMVTLGLPI